MWLLSEFHLEAEGAVVVRLVQEEEEGLRLEEVAVEEVAGHHQVLVEVVVAEERLLEEGVVVEVAEHRLGEAAVAVELVSDSARVPAEVEALEVVEHLTLHWKEDLLAQSLHYCHLLAA